MESGWNPGCSTWGEVRREAGRQSQRGMDLEASKKNEAVKNYGERRGCGQKRCIIRFAFTEEKSSVM